MQYDEIIEKLQQENNNNIINYEKIEPSILAFHEKGIQFSIICTNKNDKKFKNLKIYLEEINSQAKEYFNKRKKRRKNNPNEIYEENNYLEILKIPEELEKEEKLLDELLRIFNHSNKNIKIIKNIIKKKFDRYVFTKDNFVKMFLLIMRIRAEIPTIIMGETGCGKTFLVKMFSLLYNIPQQENENEGNQSENDINLDYIYTLKFHSGITDKDINNFIEETIRKVNKKDEDELNRNMKIFNKDYDDDKKLKDKEYYDTFILWRLFKKFPKGYKQYNKKEVKKSIKEDIESRKIIIFLDEINTCKCLGLVKNLICDKNYRKENKIPERFIFIAACNPYKILKKENQQLQFGLPLKNKNKRKLVYTVHPLPFSLLNYVFDFQGLADSTTEKYINIMIKKMITGENEESEKLILKLLKKSHFFMREKSDISSVSLREINRFGKIYIYFLHKYFPNKYKNSPLNNVHHKDSIILSLYFCYYLKIPTKELRKEYLEEIEKIEKINFEEVSKRETDYIVDKIIGKSKGYAKNRALTQNLFCEFICLENKEPLIICGKPGSSKTLSINLILKAMKGENSSDEFFKQCQEVIPSFYQCSLASTSEGIQKVFDRARQKLKNSNYQKNCLVYLDEMGIADESENNPLKVIHPELDYNEELENKEKISFVGISNWSLDASKMNRAINLIVEEPDKDYIFNTGKEIAKSIININDNKMEKLIKPISDTYYDYINEYQENKGNKYFHGLRDYYNLIKYISYNMGHIENENENKIIFNGIYRNFGGQENSIKEFINIYKTKIDKIDIKDLKYPEYNVFECIEDNLNSKIESRYLMLITKNEIYENMLYYLLKENNKKFKVLTDKDINNYDNEKNGLLNFLLQFQIYMEQEIILILKNLEVLYPSLYELFNKTISKYDKIDKKFTRISYENSQTLIYINDNFRVILLVDEEKIKNEEKPLINRFEKHILTFDNILNKNLTEVSEIIFKSFNDLIIFKYEQKEEININYNLIYNDLDLIKFLVFINKNKNNEEIQKQSLIEKIVPLFNQEMIYLLKYKNFHINNGTIINEDIKKLYKENYKKNYNLKTFLTNLKKEDIQNIIFTFTDKKESLFNKNKDDNGINNENMNIIFK